MMGSIKKNKIAIFFTLVLIVLSGVVSAQPHKNLDVIHEKSFNVNSGETLKIRTSPGDIEIKSWNRNEVFVKVWGDEDARELEFTFEYSGGEVNIEAEKENNSWWSRNRVRLYYEVKVPEEFDVKLKTSGGDIEVFDVAGMVDAKTSGGDVIIKGHEGDIEIGTSGGDIVITNSKGSVHAGTSGGDIRIATTEGRIDAGTSGGDVEVDYDGKNMGLDLSTSGGDVTINLPSDFKADIELRTSGGRVSCDVGGLSVRSKSKHKLIAEINGGGPTISASTSGGDVEVRTLR